MVPACSVKVPRVSTYSGYRHVNSPFAYGAFTLSGRLSQNRSARIVESITRSEPRDARIPVWALSISLAATLEIDVSFSSSGYLDVSVHRVPFHTLWIGVWMTGVLPAGFPHSDICGSMDICSSPQLFAAYHVFLRLLVPRHPPCALCILTSVPAASAASFRGCFCIALQAFHESGRFELILENQEYFPQFSCFTCVIHLKCISSDVLFIFLDILCVVFNVHIGNASKRYSSSLWLR